MGKINRNETSERALVEVIPAKERKTMLGIFTAIAENRGIFGPLSPSIGARI